MVQMGSDLAELVLKGIRRVHGADFVIGHQGAEFIKWPEHQNGT